MNNVSYQESEDKYDLANLVGNGSRWHVDGLYFLINPNISSTVRHMRLERKEEGIILCNYVWNYLAEPAADGYD